MKVVLKNRELIDFFDAMKQISETEKNNKWFTYAISLNEENLKSNVIAVLTCGQPNEEYIDYEKERQKLIQKYAEKDDSGNLVVDNTTSLIKIKDEYIEEARTEFNKLDEKNKDILENRDKDLQEYYNLLNREVVVDVEQTSLKNFPENINKIVMKALLPLVKKED